MIASLGYDTKNSVLEIEFNSGAIWQYSGVQNITYTKMIKADSPGRYFLDNIQDCYDEIRLR